jgi:hypothetical protein
MMKNSYISVHLQIAEQSGALENGYRVLLRDIAIERNWPEVEVDSLAIWNGVVRHSWVATNEMEDIVGGFTLVEGDIKAFPIYKDYPALLLSEFSSSEVSISGISKDYRGVASSSHIFACMYGSLYWHSMKNGIRYMYAILDRGINALYKRKLGLNFVKIGDNFMKWGEEVFPARLDVSTVKETLLTTKPEVWKTFLHYQPLDMQAQSA